MLQHAGLGEREEEDDEGGKKEEMNERWVIQEAWMMKDWCESRPEFLLLSPLLQHRPARLAGVT